jgi:hypothetical protein
LKIKQTVFSLGTSISPSAILIIFTADINKPSIGFQNVIDTAEILFFVLKVSEFWIKLNFTVDID